MSDDPPTAPPPMARCRQCSAVFGVAWCEFADGQHRCPSCGLATVELIGTDDGIAAARLIRHSTIQYLVEQGRSAEEAHEIAEHILDDRPDPPWEELARVVNDALGWHERLLERITDTWFIEIGMRRHVVCGKSPAEAREIVKRALERCDGTLPCPTFDEL